MEGLELFAGSSPADRALVDKLKSVQEELADYKEEHRYAEARVSAHAHVLRLLVGEPIAGMCSACYLKLKKRVRALESEHLSPAALAGPPRPQDEPEQLVQGDGLEIGSAEGAKEGGPIAERAARPVRAARRIPRQVEEEQVEGGLAALTRIKVAQLEREPSSADSVAAVMDNSRLAAVAAHAGEPLLTESLGANLHGGQDESQGEAEGSVTSPAKVGPEDPPADDIRSGSKKAALAAEPSASLQEDSGDCSVNGALKEGGSEAAEQTASGRSPFNKSDYKSVGENDSSSEEGSTARAGEALESGGAGVGRTLDRVLNLSIKSTGSSASSIVGPAPEPEKSERGGSSEGPAESEWKDALDGRMDNEDDLLDDGDSKSPMPGPSPKDWGAAVEGAGEKEGEARCESVGQAEGGQPEKVESAGKVEPAPVSLDESEAGGPGGDNEEGSLDGGKRVSKQLKKAVVEKEENEDGEGRPIAAKDRNPGSHGSPKEAVEFDCSELDDISEETGEEAVNGVGATGGSENEEPKSGELETGAGPTKNDVYLDRPVPGVPSEKAAVESAAEVEEIDVDVEMNTEDVPAGGEPLKPDDKALEGDDGEGLQTAGSGAAKGGSPLKTPAGRRRVSPTFSLYVALQDAAKTTQEGQSNYEVKRERNERLLRQKAERESARAAAEREEQLTRLAASRKSSLAETGRGEATARPLLEKGKENRNPVGRSAAEKMDTAAPQAMEAEDAGQGGPPAGDGGPAPAARSFSQALASGVVPESNAVAAERAEPAPGGEKARKLTMAERKAQMVSKRDFVYNERDRATGRLVNILQGLELHKNFLNPKEQAKLVERIYDLQEKGRAGELMPRTYTQPRKWMRGKGRVTIQFGCCYNYAIDKFGNPPGIMRGEEVDPLPSIINSVITRLVDWGIMPEECRPDSCIVNIYDEGDCIPPHIDHHDFLRPFCTLSLLTEAEIVFGTRLETVGEGLFDGPVRIALPVGSVLILNGNGADVAKHCIPGVPAKRISITLRKMDPAKAPYHLTQTALRTPLPGPPLPPAPQSERGAATDSWRRAPEAGGTHTRFGSPKPEEKNEDNQEAWPELGVGKKRSAEGGEASEVVVPAPKGVWGKRQEERADAGGKERPPEVEKTHWSREGSLPSEEAIETDSKSVIGPPELTVEQSASDPSKQAAELEQKPETVSSQPGPGAGAWAKPLTSTLRAQAPPFEAPPKRLASPSLDVPPRKMAPLDRGVPSSDSPPWLPGGLRTSSTSLTSSPAKKWAASTETPVAAASDLAMAVRKMVGGEGARLVEAGQRHETGPSEAARRQGAGLSAAAPEFAPPRREEGARPQSGGLERNPARQAVPADKFVDDSTSWADIEVDSGSPRRGGWQPPPRGASAGRSERAGERSFDRREYLERSMRAFDLERALERTEYHDRGLRALGVGFSEGRADPRAFPEARSADRLGRLGFPGYTREPAGDLQRWGHDERGLGREPLWPEDHGRFARVQDDLYSGSRGSGNGRTEGPGFREFGFDRQGNERDPRGERLVTHPKAEALREAGDW